MGDPPGSASCSMLQVTGESPMPSAPMHRAAQGLV